MLTIAPHIAHNARKTCRFLQLYGGAVVNGTGDVCDALTYVRKEGVTLGHIVYMERVDTGEEKAFLLDVYTGDYVSGTDRLWPLGHAYSEHLQRQVLAYMPHPKRWRKYWARGDALRDAANTKRTRLRQHIWTSRKRCRRH